MSARLRKVVLFLGMVLASVVMLYPIYYMVDTSFRSSTQYDQDIGHSVQTWLSLLGTVPIGQLLLNSTIVSVSALGVILIVSTTAGFALAKLPFPGHTLAYSTILACMLVPIQSIVLPEYTNLANLGLVNNYLSAILVYAALGIPFSTFLMTAYFRSLPDELVEAGVMDGLSYPKVFSRIALPLALPAIATVIVLQFIQIWGDPLIGLLFLQTPGTRTLTAGLAVLSAGRTTSIPLLMAGALVSTIPAVVVYLILQRHLVRGLTVGITK